jgi:hypothetical protein
MSRAKALKSLFRMVTPNLTIKDIPLIVVNHTYKEMALYPRDVVSGGTGIYYSADTIWILGRQQEKDGKDITGYNFIINVEKSRYVKEKSKIPVNVSYDAGISKWSGLLDLALEGGFIAKPTSQSYQLVDQETGEVSGKKYKVAEIEYNDEVWEELIANTGFAEWIKNKYSLIGGNLIKKEKKEIPDS